MTDRGRGFSLLEVVLALGVLAILAAGLLRFLAGCCGALARTVEGVELRRGLRVALEHLSDDLQAAGFLVPCRPPPGHPLLQVAGDGLTLIKDEVLPGQGRLGAPIAGGDPAPRMRLEAADPVRLLRGDLVLVEDGAWEGFRLEAPLDLPGEAPVAPLGGEGARDHAAGAPVTFLRPLRRVAYRLEGAALVRRTADLGGETPLTLAHGLEHFRAELRGGAVEVTLVARGPSGARCALTLTRAPRNLEPP